MSSQDYALDQLVDVTIRGAQIKGLADAVSGTHLWVQTPAGQLLDIPAADPAVTIAEVAPKPAPVEAAPIEAAPAVPEWQPDPPARDMLRIVPDPTPVDLDAEPEAAGETVEDGEVSRG